MDSDDVVWVPSQSPALSALITEAENDRKTRPSTPVHHPPFSSGRSCGSFSPFTLAPRGSDPSASRSAHPLSAVHRHPLASSASSANRPPRHSARPRSSSVASNGNYTLKDDEPEALHFIQLLKHANKQVDINSEKKERAVLEKEGRTRGREHSRPKNGISHASTVPSVKPPDKTYMSARQPEFSGRILTKTASLGAPGAYFVSGKSTPTSFPSPDLNCDLKLAPASRSHIGASHPNPSTINVKNTAEMNDDDSAMQNVIDLAETDSELERPIPALNLRTNTSMCMQVDEKTDSDVEMDLSVFKPEPPPPPRTSAPNPKSWPPQPTRPSAPTQRARTGPPPLGMRRAPQFQPTQSTSTQSSKGVTVPRFKPPLPASAGGTSSENGSRPKPVPVVHNARLPARAATAGAPPARPKTSTNQDPDSSFDMSFDIDPLALEEAMKAYD